MSEATATHPATLPSGLHRSHQCVVVASFDADVRTELARSLERIPALDVHEVRSPGSLVDVVYGLRRQRDPHRMLVIVDDRSPAFRRAGLRAASTCPDVAVEVGSTVACAIERAREAPTAPNLASRHAAVVSLVDEVRAILRDLS